MKYFLIFLAALVLAACDCNRCNTPTAEKKAVWVAPNGDTARYYDRLIAGSPDSLKVHKFLSRKYSDEYYLVELYGNCAIMDDSRRLFMPAKCPGDTLKATHDTIKVSTPCDSPTFSSSSKWTLP